MTIAIVKGGREAALFIAGIEVSRDCTPAGRMRLLSDSVPKPLKKVLIAGIPLPKIGTAGL
jgi:hypothetical protein